MRTTTLLKALLGMQHLRVTGFAVEAGALVIEVWRRRCQVDERERDDPGTAQFQHRSAGRRHLIPDAKRARSEPVANRSEQVTAPAEEIEYEALDREKPLT